MKRLNDDELNVRIHSFLNRKMEEFPELKPGNGTNENAARAARENIDVFRTTSRFGFHWHNEPHTA
jgi:hypothetical protein